MPDLVGYSEEVLDSIEEVEEEPVYHCDYCGAEHGDDDSAYECCRHACPSCGAEHRYEDEAFECCRYQCPDCGASYEYEEDSMSCCRSSEFYSGDMPYLPDGEVYKVEVPSIPGRPARLCSLEQELVSGGSMVARLLYNIGASPEDHKLSYHSSTGRRTAHVEDDGSLPDQGGEVVYDRFDLSQDADVAILSKALTKIRQLRDEPGRPVTTGFAAGVHVHISARAENGETMTPQSVAALYELWNYAEDVLYAISAAGWNRHRQPNDAYGGYCKPLPKDGATPRDVWRLMRHDRYFGLNFARLFEAPSRCSCGAATMGDWESCDCGAFDKATVEWRVFNSSTLPRTIHAWIVLAHAMTAYSAQHELGTLEQHPLGSQNAEEKQMVFDHLLRILPLTDGERDLLTDAWDRSPV